MNKEEKIKEYLKVKEEAERLKSLADNLKTEIDLEMEDDKVEIPNVGVFQRRKPSVQRRLDKKLVAQKMPPEDFEQCFKEINVKGSIVIMSWESYQNQQKMLKGKKK